MPVVTLCSSIQGSREVACKWALPWCEFVEGGCTGNSECVGHSCAFSQAAETMCSSLLRDPWPCCAGPLVKSRDYLKKKKKKLGNLSCSFMFFVLTSYVKQRQSSHFCTEDPLHQIAKYVKLVFNTLKPHFQSLPSHIRARCLCTASNFLKKIVSHVNMHLPWQWQPGVKPWTTWT